MAHGESAEVAVEQREPRAHAEGHGARLQPDGAKTDTVSGQAPGDRDERSTTHPSICNQCPGVAKPAVGGGRAREELRCRCAGERQWTRRLLQTISRWRFRGTTSSLNAAVMQPPVSGCRMFHESPNRTYAGLARAGATNVLSRRRIQAFESAVGDRSCGTISSRMTCWGKRGLEVDEHPRDGTCTVGRDRSCGVHGRWQFVWQTFV